MEHILEKSQFNSIKLEKMQPSRNLYELDLTVWLLLRETARASPAAAAKYLGISEGTARKLAQTCDSRMAALGSGIFLSFTFYSKDEELLSLVKSSLVKDKSLLSALLSPKQYLNKKLDSSLCERYWRVMREIATTEGAKVAALALGTDYSLAKEVSNLSDSELALLSQKGKVELKLRFKEHTLRQLLSRENNVHHTLLRYQQSLTNTQRLTPPAQEDNTHDLVDQNETCGPNRSSIIRSYEPTWIKGKHLAALGFIARALQIEVGISEKQVVRLRKEIRDQGEEIARSSSKLRSGSFVQSYTTSIQASLVMLCYHKYSSQKTNQNIDIKALVSSLILYHKVRNELDLKESQWELIDVNAAYSLAKELRGTGLDSQAYFIDCEKCSTKNFVSVNQRVRSEDNCPFCRVTDAEKIKAA